jgi:putative hydrolase of the HAD superfamily
VQTIIFDIGGVLISFDFVRLAQELSRRTGQEPEKLLPCFRAATVRDVETGAVGPEEFFDRTMAPLLRGMGYEDWIRAWMDNYSINEPGWALLELARRHGRTVCILSNLAHYNQVAIERKFPHFFQTTDHNFYSYELGLHKPAPEIFLKVSDLLGTEPGDCFFLDDVAENVDGARQSGMSGMQFANARIGAIREALGLVSEASAFRSTT